MLLLGAGTGTYGWLLSFRARSIKASNEKCSAVASFSPSLANAERRNPKVAMAAAVETRNLRRSIITFGKGSIQAGGITDVWVGVRFQVQNLESGRQTVSG